MAPAGYSSYTETQLNVVTGFGIAIGACAAGYASAGTPAAVECDAQGGAYTIADPCVGQ